MSSLKEMVVALGAGVALAVIVACGGGQKALSPAAPGSAGPVMTNGSKQQITELDNQINLEFAKLEAGPRPVVAADLCPTPPCTTFHPVAVKPSSDLTCTHGDSQTCKDTCQIADAICDAAIKICDIAKDLNDDAWATEKCSSGNASCEKSRGKCCGCS